MAVINALLWVIPPKLLWQPLKIAFDMIFRSASYISLNICTEPLKFLELSQFKKVVSIYIYILFFLVVAKNR